MSTGAEVVDRIADSVAEAICRCRAVLGKLGVVSDVDEEIDEAAMRGTVVVRVNGVEVYSIYIDLDDECAAVTGRWSEEGLIAVGLVEVATRVGAIRQWRTS